MTDTTMNTGAASLSDEQIEALKAAALAATPQEIDSAQSIDHYEDGSFITCPACGGEGYVELNADFCNYDGEALGVQFYGIGNAHALAEAYFRAANPATVLALIERLERAEATPTPQADAAPSVEQIILAAKEFAARYAGASHENRRIAEQEFRAAIAAGGAQEPVTDQQIYDEFGFLEGLVNESTYRRIAETAITIYKSAPLPREAATVGITAARYIVIGYGETDHPQAAFVNEREHLLDAVLGMIYTHPSDACDETREEYRHDLADDDEWSHEGIWRTEFEIGGVVIYDLGAPAAASNGEQA